MTAIKSEVIWSYFDSPRTLASISGSAASAGAAAAAAGCTPCAHRELLPGAAVGRRRICGASRAQPHHDRRGRAGGSIRTSPAISARPPCALRRSMGEGGP